MNSLDIPAQLCCLYFSQMMLLNYLNLTFKLIGIKMLSSHIVMVVSVVIHFISVLKKFCLKFLIQRVEFWKMWANKWLNSLLKCFFFLLDVGETSGQILWSMRFLFFLL